MDCNRLNYIKSVTDKGDETQWAYSAESIASNFNLNFKIGKGVKFHARKLPKGSLIILSQVPHECKDKTTGEQKKIPDGYKKRYLTHVVELVRDGSEDERKWGEEPGTWEIFREVKVHWIADLNNYPKIPIEYDVMKVKLGLRNTYAISLPKIQLLKKQWKHDEDDEQWMNKLKERLIEELNLESIT